MNKTIVFCATGKSGLGHLRRLTLIATAIHKISPNTPLVLLTNASAAGLTEQELTLYSSIIVIDRKNMSARLKLMDAGVVIVDTAILPGIADLTVPLVLVLRETITKRLSDFSLPNGRPWDLLLLPNPSKVWQPPWQSVYAKRKEYLGWIYRNSGDETNEYPDDDADIKIPRILLSTGGGGADSWHRAKKRLSYVLVRVRQKIAEPIIVSQVVAPRASTDSLVQGVDELLYPGSMLHKAFHQADLVISTAGYNSTLELAGTRVPVLFVPMQRTYDDQFARARHWAREMGLVFQDADNQTLVDWIIDVLVHRRIRNVVKLGPSGENQAAALLQDYLQ